MPNMRSQYVAMEKVETDYAPLKHVQRTGMYENIQNTETTEIYPLGEMSNNEEFNSQELMEDIIVDHKEISKESIQLPEMTVAWGGSQIFKTDVVNEVICHVKNKSSEHVPSYQLKFTLPEQIHEEEAIENLIRSCPSLASQEVYPHALYLIANEPGTYTLQATILFADQELYTADYAITVEEPKDEIAIEIDAPIERNIDTDIIYTIQIANIGKTTVENIIFQNIIPDIFRFENASVEPTYSQESNCLEWNIDSLQPSEVKTIEVHVMAEQAGEHKIKLFATNEENTISVSKETSIMVVGTIGLHISHKDLDDPIQVGKKLTYRIEITNQGQVDATEIVITDILPLEVTFIEATSMEFPELQYTVDKNKVMFDPISALQPDETIVIEVKSIVNQAGDLKNRVETKTKEFGKAIINEEGTTAFD